MTESPRTSIRKAAMAILATPATVDDAPVYPTPADGRVYPNRSLPLQHSQLPALLAYTLTEALGDKTGTGPNDYLQVLDLLIEVRLDGDDTLHDELDDFAYLVKCLILATPRLGLSFVKYVVYHGTEFSKDQTGERVMGLATLTFKVTYYPPDTQDISELADFLRFRGRVKPGPPTGELEIPTSVDFPPPEEP